MLVHPIIREYPFTKGRPLNVSFIRTWRRKFIFIWSELRFTSGGWKNVRIGNDVATTSNKPYGQSIKPSFRHFSMSWWVDSFSPTCPDMANVDPSRRIHSCVMIFRVKGWLGNPPQKKTCFTLKKVWNRSIKPCYSLPLKRYSNKQNKTTW